MDLQKLLLPEKVVTFEFPGFDGVTFDLAFLAKEELIKIQELCTTKRVNKKTRQMEDHFDSDKFQEIFIKRTIKGWTGLKIKYLKELVLINTSGVDEEEEVEYTPDQAVTLMKNSNTLDNWISEQVGDLGNFMDNNSTTKSSVSKSTSSTLTKVSTETDS